MNLIEKLFSVTPDRSKKIAGILLTITAIAEFLAIQFEDETAKWTFGIIGGICGIIAGKMMSDTIPVSAVKGMTHLKRKKLRKKLHSKSNFTEHDENLLCEIQDVERKL